ncbi:hypothetical protein FRB95_010811 [Tulasnella sp. JGI-2019a]|nr:hypothetical protein FRB95_010811 [Tulasnella sp. JGI-2019a]
MRFIAPTTFFIAAFTAGSCFAAPTAYTHEHQLGRRAGWGVALKNAGSDVKGFAKAVIKGGQRVPRPKVEPATVLLVPKRPTVDSGVFAKVKAKSTLGPDNPLTKVKNAFLDLTPRKKTGIVLGSAAALGLGTVVGVKAHDAYEANKEPQALKEIDATMEEAAKEEANAEGAVSEEKDGLIAGQALAEGVNPTTSFTTADVKTQSKEVTEEDEPKEVEDNEDEDDEDDGGDA